MRLIALKTARYGTRALRAGDPFDAQPEYGRIWKLLGMAADAPKTPEVKAEEPKRRGRKPRVAVADSEVDAILVPAAQDCAITPNEGGESVGVPVIGEGKLTIKDEYNG